MSTDVIAQWRGKLSNPGTAAAALAQLVITELYVLVPGGSVPPEWLTSDLPDGQRAVPCFLSEAAARTAAGSRAQLVRVMGRDLFGSLPATAVVLEPHDLGLVLTPTLMQAMLASVPAAVTVGSDRTLAAWSAAADLPARVRDSWNAVLLQFPVVVAAYWLRIADGHLMHRRLVTLTRGADDTLSLLETMMVALRASYAGPLRIEAQALAEGELPEAHRRLESLDPFYLALRTG